MLKLKQIRWIPAICSITFLTAVYAGPTNAQEVVITVKPDQPDEPTTKPVFVGKRASADLAILLDTSNSMDGLIKQAKSQLWNIIQRFAAAKKAGQTPALRVAVFEYGNSSLPASEGYIRQVIGLTDDLDKVSEALFALTTDGGDEYCGTVIAEAVKRLDWSKEPNSHKSIFIAGNEPFTQGEVNYKTSCKNAIENGVLVNTIHCGDYSTGVKGQWRDGAQLAEGEFMNINQDKAVVAIKTPHDKILIELNQKLNKTYMWFGAKDKRGRWAANQTAQDENAFELQGVVGLSSRAGVKGSSVYSNVDRDLIDSFKANRKVLDDIEEDELPDALQNVPAGKRVEIVKEQTAKRAEIQKKIAEVNVQRLKYIADEKKKLARDNTSTLGDAIEAAVTKQMKEAGFTFGK